MGTFREWLRRWTTTSGGASAGDSYAKAGAPGRLAWHRRLGSRKGGPAADHDHTRSLLAALEAAAGGIAVTDAAGTIVWANSAFSSLTGYCRDEIMGQNPRILKSGRHDATFYREMWATIASGRVWRGELANRRKDGSVYDEAMTITPVRDASGEIVNYVAVKEDISERKRVERNLRLVRDAMDQAPDAVFWIKSDGGIEYANEETGRSLAYSLEELRTKALWDIAPDIPFASFADVWAAIRQQRLRRSRRSFRRSDGTVFPVELSVKNIEFHGNEYVVAVAHDLTLRAMAETALVEQKHLFDVVMDNLPEHVYFKDRESRFIRISRAQARWLGLSDPAEAVGLSDFDFFSAEHADAAYAAEREIMRTGSPVVDLVEKETWFDGRETWVATTKMPLRDREGRIAGTFGVSRDITRQQRAEKALRASQELKERIIESSHDGICVLDLQGRVLFMSPGARRLLKIGAHERSCDLPWARDWELGIGAAPEALRSARAGGVGTFQIEAPVGDEARSWEVVLSPIKNETGSAESLVCSFRDVTDRRVLERRLAQAEKLESIGQLAAGIAHEINTPVQYVGDNTRFLLDAFGDLGKLLDACAEAGAGGLPPERVASTLGQLAEAADLGYLREEIPKALEQSIQGLDHVSGIVRAMKEFSHQAPAEMTPTDLNHTIETALTVSRNEWKYVADIIKELDPGLPLITCQPGEVNQVILNLVINAAHAIAEVVASGVKGTITLSTRRDGDNVEIRVRDTGGGIPERIRSRVFDPFFTTKAVGKGTGQGLAIAHDIVVRKHNGAITFQPEPGGGTTFIVRLPILQGSQ